MKTELAIYMSSRAAFDIHSISASIFWAFQREHRNVCGGGFLQQIALQLASFCFLCLHVAIRCPGSDPNAIGQHGPDHALIGGVVAVVVFITLCLIIVLGRYLARHKGKPTSRYVQRFSCRSTLCKVKINQLAYVS